MRRLRHLLAAALVTLAIAHVALGQATAPPRRAVDPAAEARKLQQMEGILKLWEQQSAGRTTIEVTFTRLDVSDVWGNTEYRGKASLQSPNLVRLELQKVDRDKNPPIVVPHEQILCTGTAVLQYAYDTKQIFVFPLAKEERKRVLDEGPLPFLFNMRADELKKRYTLFVSDENQDVYLIGVIPRWESDKETFSRAFIWLNKKSFLPDKLRLVAPNGKDTKQYTFRLIRENDKLDPKLFVGTRPAADWTVVQNTGAPQPPAPRAGAQGPARNRQ